MSCRGRGGRVTLGSVPLERVLVGMPPACAPAQADEPSAGGRRPAQHQGTGPGLLTCRAVSGADPRREGSGSCRSAAEGNPACLQAQFRPSRSTCQTEVQSVNVPCRSSRLIRKNREDAGSSRPSLAKLRGTVPLEKTSHIPTPPTITERAHRQAPSSSDTFIVSLCGRGARKTRTKQNRTP